MSDRFQRTDLVYFLDLCQIPYKQRCIWQGDYDGIERKLYSIETQYFAYLERMEFGEVIGYVFDKVTPQNIHDLQNWYVAKDIVIDFLA